MARLPNDVQITDGDEKATITTDGYLDVETHSPADGNPNSNKCFSADYSGAQTAAAILTPTSGTAIVVKQVYASSSVTNVDVTLAFATSAKTVFKLYTANKATAVGNVLCGEGAVDEALSLTCGASTFVSISYDEI